MLIDAQGTRLREVRKATHWGPFEALQQNPALAVPLKEAINDYVSELVNQQVPSGDVAIDSTLAGPQVFSRVGSEWLSRFTQWNDKMCTKNPEHKKITPERIYGMMLWYVLACVRPERERWIASPPGKGRNRVYKLEEAAAELTMISVDRQMLIELRQSLRDHLAKLDDVLGNA